MRRWPVSSQVQARGAPVMARLGQSTPDEFQEHLEAVKGQGRLVLPRHAGCSGGKGAPGPL